MRLARCLWNCSRNSCECLQEREVERLGDTRTIPVNIRIIATTNVSLEEMVEQGHFRADLYYRLNVIPLTLPPLRERADDIPVLAEYFAAKFSEQAWTSGAGVASQIPDCVAEPQLARECPRTLQFHAAGGGHEPRDQHSTRTSLLRNSRGRPQSRCCLVQVAVQAGTPMRELERQLLETTLQLTGGNRHACR